MIDECCDKEYIEKLRNKIYRLQTENAQYREALYIACNKNQENIKISMALSESKMIKNGVLAMKFEEWWNEKALRYFAIIRENGSMSAERVVDLEQSCKRLACIAWRAAQPKWQPIETAPKEGYLSGSDSGFQAGVNSYSVLHEMQDLIQRTIDFALDVPECGCSRHKVCASCKRYEEAQGLVSELKTYLRG